MGMRVLVADAIASEGLAVLEKTADLVVDVQTKLSHTELLERIGEYDALIVRSQTQVTEDVLVAGKQLTIVGRAGVGVDNIDVAAATRQGILVVNAPEGNTVSTAEHTMAMIMALARHIPQGCASLKAGAWERGKFMGVQLAGKTLGVLGMGRIGSEVARRAVALDMKVIAYDPFVTPEKAKRLGVELGSVNDVCSQANFITVHTPLTPETTGLIGSAQFALMKPGVRIVNCARGGIIDEAALLTAIQTGKVAGAALDVFVEEPPKGNPLLALPQVIATPHLGASTVEAQVNVAVAVAHSVVDALAGKPVQAAVNAPYLRGLLQDEKGYLGLAERLGGFFTSLFGGGFTQVSLTFAGECAAIDSEALSAMFLRGLLTPLAAEVNYVNARIAAEDRGLEIHETRKPNAEGFTNLIVVQGSGQKGTHSISANLTAELTPRIVDIDGYSLNVEPNGPMVVAQNIDQPGIIGRVGTVLGSCGVNIGYMQVGRKDKGNLAMMVLGVDNPLTAGTQAQLEQIAELRYVRTVQW